MSTDIESQLANYFAWLDDHIESRRRPTVDIEAEHRRPRWIVPSVAAVLAVVVTVTGLVVLRDRSRPTTDKPTGPLLTSTISPSSTISAPTTLPEPSVDRELASLEGRTFTVTGRARGDETSMTICSGFLESNPPTCNPTYAILLPNPAADQIRALDATILQRGGDQVWTDRWLTVELSGISTTDADGWQASTARLVRVIPTDEQVPQYSHAAQGTSTTSMPADPDVLRGYLLTIVPMISTVVRAQITAGTDGILVSTAFPLTPEGEAIATSYLTGNVTFENWAVDSSGAPRTCTGDDLTAVADPNIDGAMSNTRLNIVVTNSSTTSCRLLDSAPTIAGIAADGSTHPLAAIGGDTFFGVPAPLYAPLKPGQRAAVWISGGQPGVCPPTTEPTVWPTMRLRLADGSSLDFTTSFDTGCPLKISTFGALSSGASTCLAESDGALRPFADDATFAAAAAKRFAEIQGLDALPTGTTFNTYDALDGGPLRRVLDELVERGVIGLSTGMNDAEIRLAVIRFEDPIPSPDGTHVFRSAIVAAQSSTNSLSAHYFSDDLAAEITSPVLEDLTSSHTQCVS